MSIRRINSTGRKKIVRDDAQIVVHMLADGRLSFDARLTLSEYDLPSDSSVHVEAYRQTNFMRFEYGTVGSPHPPADADHYLTEFVTKDGLLFRVKVTSVGARPGLLLAEGDGIPCREEEDEPDKRLPLLPPAPGELGQEVWKVDFTPSGPLLLVNKRLDWKSVASSPTFRSLVFPSATRQVLSQILLVERESDFEDMQSWRSRWLRFAIDLGAGDPPIDLEDDDEVMEWIDGAAERFCSAHGWLTHFQGELRVESSL